MARTIKDITGIVTFEVAMAQADQCRKQEQTKMAEVWEYLAIMTMQLSAAQRKIDLLERNALGI